MITWRIANLTQSWHVHDHAQDHVLEGLDAERGVGLDGVGQRQVEEVHRPTLPDVAQALVPYSQVLPTIRGKTILSDTVKAIDRNGVRSALLLIIFEVSLCMKKNLRTYIRIHI